MKTLNVLFKIFAIVLFAIVFVFSSCKREKISDSAEESASDESLASNLFDDAFDQAEDAFSAKLSGTKSAFEVDTLSCSVINVYHLTDSASFPKRIEIDFGTGCTDRNNVVRQGKIILEVTGYYRTVGAKRTITFSGYKVNGYQIEGTKTVTNMGVNGSGQSYFTIKVENGKITTPEGKTITWSSDRTRTWVQGENTLGWRNIFDDVYEITGTASGTGREGQSYTVTITKALQIQVGCRYIQKGELTIKVDDNPDVVIDYGDGSCDSKATMTYKKKTREFTMRGH